MSDAEQRSGLVACEACGAAAARRSDLAGTAAEPTCPRCGNDTFSDLRDPSRL